MYSHVKARKVLQVYVDVGFFWMDAGFVAVDW
jgi:hypothetical protein